MPAPPISLTCDCGTRGSAVYGERWTCPTCGKSYDTSRIPADDYEALARGVRRYKWIALGPPVAVAALLLPAAVLLDDIRYAFLCFVLVMGYGLLALPRLRSGQTARLRALSSRWKLEAD